MWLIPIIGLIIGILIGIKIPIVLTAAYSQYLSIAILAALDSIFGGIRAGIEHNFDTKIFLTGFFSNILLASGLAYLGDLLGVELYTAAVFVFGVRLFQNLAIIRRLLIKK